MARYRNSVTRVVVNVDDATAAQLGPAWVDADVAQEPETAPAETDGAEDATEDSETETATEQELETAPAKSRARNTK